MSSATNRITIDRPIQDVFDVLTDVERSARWFPGDVEEHWTSPPPRSVGSTRHAIVRMGRRRSENDAVITEYDPPHRAVMKGISPNAPFLVTLAFARDAGGTQVMVTTEFAFRGAMRLIGPPFAAWYGRAWGRGLRTLKTMMEAGDL